MASSIGEIYRRHLPEKVVERDELHVLAVDDNNVDRIVIERLLKILSCRVTVVDSGTRALQYLGLDGEKSSAAAFDDLKVNLIMTDYSMPGMTGYELLKKIKESSAFKEVPVVIMSSENILTRIDRCLEEGAEEFIVKPVKLSDVKRLKEVVLKCDVHKDSEQSSMGKRGVNSNHKRNFEEVADNHQSTSLSLPNPCDQPRHLKAPLLSSSLISCDLSLPVQPSSPHCPSKRPKFAIETSLHMKC